MVLLGFLGLNYFTESDLSLVAEDEDKIEIAYIDMQAVYNQHPAKEAAELELGDTARQLEARLNEEFEDLPGEEQRDMLESYQADLSRREQQLMEEILQNINEVINKIAAEQEYKVVLTKEDVVYGGYDITEKVINYIDKNVDIENDLEVNIDLLQE